MVSVACLTIGSTVIYDGDTCTVLALADDRVTLQARSGTSRSVRAASLLTAAGTKLVDPDARLGPVAGVGASLASLTDTELVALYGKAAHLRELLTGYRSGSPEDALPGEPRPAFAAGVPLMERYSAKAQELGVGVTTVRRWVRAFERDGEAGLIDARRQRSSGPASRSAASIRVGLRCCA